MKNLLTHFSKIRGYFSASQGNDVGYDCRLTVVQPSFDCRSIMLKLCSVLAILFIVGVGNAMGADETLTLNGDDWSTGSYSTGAYSKNTSASNSITYWYKRTYKNSGIQMEKNTGEIYSSSYPASNNKIKSINITNSANSVNLYCSCDGYTWSSALSYTSGTALNVSSNNYKYFKVCSNTGKYAKLTSIVVTYTTSSAQTVTFEKEGGTFDDPSVFINDKQIAELSNGAGIILPSASPSAACATEGWAFYGWALSAVSSETTTAPVIVGKAGDRYYPAKATTLYAVYVNGGEYTKISSTGDLSSGAKFLFVGVTGGHNYIMKSSCFDFKNYSGYGGMEGAQVDESSSGKYTAADVDVKWCYTIEGSTGEYYIRDVVNSSSENYADIYYGYFWRRLYDSEDDYSITVSSGTWTIKNNYYNSGYSYLGLDDDDLAFFGYSSAQAIYLYKQTDAPSFYSNPSCATCDDNPTIGAASLNGTFD